MYFPSKPVTINLVLIKILLLLFFIFPSKTFQTHSFSRVSRTLEPVQNKSILANQRQFFISNIMKFRPSLSSPKTMEVNKIHRAKRPPRPVSFHPIISPSRQEKKVITILGLFETSQNQSQRKFGEIEKAAAELALEDINNDEETLGDYQLTMHTNDTQCDPGTGVDAFFHALYAKHDARIISLLGTACSEVTERLAKVVTHWNIVQVSFGSTSPSLSDRKEFPLFFRTVSPVASHSAAIIELIKHFQWDTVTFFTKNENRFTMPANYLMTELEKANVTCKATLTFSLSDYKNQLKDMKELDSRIIIANFGPDVAPLIFCEVYNLGMYGSDYAWILIGKPETNWWKITLTPRYVQDIILKSKRNISNVTTHTNESSDDKCICTDKELRKAVENTLVVDRYNELGANRSSISKMNTSSFNSKLKLRVKNITEESPFAPEAYDAMWSLALGLHRVHKTYNYSLENFNYTDEDFSKNLRDEIGKLNFKGISGPISFSGSDRIGITSFKQIQDGEMISVGLFNPQDSWLNLNCSNRKRIRWDGNQVPIARREFRIKLIQVERSLYIIVAAIASLGIVMAVSFLAFNLYHRKLKYIKLSSPRLNNMVIIGCIFAYISVILLGADFGFEPDGKHFAYVCTIRAYLLSTGFSLAFGAMFAKTYRVHRIFTRSCIGVVKNKLLRDTQLMTLIMALLVIDCIIVSSWAVFDPMHKNLRNLTLEINPADRSVVFQPQISVCTSQQGHVWLSILYGYKSLLLVVGLYMAWETRHVKIQALNDSKYIGLCVYIAVLTSVLCVSLANLISERVTLSFMSVTTLILASTTITLCLLFLPKIHAIMKNPNPADPIVESMGLKIEFNTRRFMTEDTKELLFRAEVQNRVYKRQIETIDVEIWRLESLLYSSKNSQSSLASNNVLKDGKKIDGGIITVQGPSPGTSLSDDNESKSEIFTIYLRGPRLIIPISLFNFDNSSNSSNLRVDGTTRAVSSVPRSSWPNTISHLTVPSNGLIAKKYNFKSEPKLLTEADESDRVPQGPINIVTMGDDDNISTTFHSKSSRKSSKDSGKRSTLLSVLKHPINYFTGFIRPANLDIATDKISSLSPVVSPKEIQHRQFNSVPDLWAVRNSPILETQQNRKKMSTNSDSVADTNSITQFLFSNVEPLHRIEDPVLKLIVTSNESPYL